MNRKACFSLIVILVFAYFSSITSAETRINDITLEHESQVVKLKGKVIATEPKDPDLPDLEGTYTLKDEYSGSIKVWTEKLPNAGEYVTIKGTVAVDQDGMLMIRQQPPSLVDLYLKYVVIVAVAAVVILLVVLIILTGRSKQVEPVSVIPGVQPEAAKSETTPASAAGPTEKLIEPRAAMLITEGAYAGKTYNITKADIVIGRGDECDIQLPESDTSVSRQHVRIKHANKQYTMINESETNPAKINGEAIASKVLEDGDEIQLGNTKIQFKLESSG